MRRGGCSNTSPGPSLRRPRPRGGARRPSIRSPSAATTSAWATRVSCTSRRTARPSAAACTSRFTAASRERTQSTIRSRARRATTPGPTRIASSCCTPRRPRAGGGCTTRTAAGTGGATPARNTTPGTARRSAPSWPCSSVFPNRGNSGSECLDDYRLFANRFFEAEYQPGAPQLIDQARQVVLHMAALAEEHRDHPDRAHALRDERVHAFLERSAVLQVRQPDARRGKLLREARRDALERPRPLRIARPVSDENDALLQCRVARRPS